jgi:hypothetical protein
MVASFLENELGKNSGFHFHLGRSDVKNCTEIHLQVAMKKIIKFLEYSFQALQKVCKIMCKE